MAGPISIASVIDNKEDDNDDDDAECIGRTIHLDRRHCISLQCAAPGIGRWSIGLTLFTPKARGASIPNGAAS